MKFFSVPLPAGMPCYHKTQLWCCVLLFKSYSPKPTQILMDTFTLNLAWGERRQAREKETASINLSRLWYSI